MALARLGQSMIRRLHRTLHPPPPAASGAFKDCHGAAAQSLALLRAGAYGRGLASLACNDSSVMIGHRMGGPSPAHLVKVLDIVVHLNHARPMSTATASKVPVGARKVGLKVVMMSPGIVYDPYSPREPIPFWKST
ncbi:hypothetical protein U9M48_041125 [Paspalum notatum var. saurae]|uniref:Uncharacterized protein n=1 Tax=Paspalum notatum var. saurae TaxID=547442 RepID=A0AAQ3URX6_PASNO